jgi:hypothetical protein
LSHRNAVFQRNEDILLSAESHAISPSGRKLRRYGTRGGKSNMLFIETGYANGARILTAVAGIDVDKRHRSARPSGFPPWSRVRRQQYGRRQAVR